MRLAFISLIICSLFATGCSWVKFPGVRKVEIQQGNIVDQEMIDKLRPVSGSVCVGHTACSGHV